MADLLPSLPLYILATNLIVFGAFYEKIKEHLLGINIFACFFLCIGAHAFFTPLPPLPPLLTQIVLGFILASLCLIFVEITHRDNP